MKKKGIAILSTCIASVCALSVGVGIATSADSAEGWSKEDAYSAEYAHMDTINVEAKTFAKGGETYDADALVCFPDGSVETGSTVTLTQAGTYTVKYTAKVGDSLYAHKESFLVNYPMYSVSNYDKSKVSYGTPERASSEGVVASIAQNDSLVFTQYIDFTKITADDKLVTGYVCPENAGALEFGELIFTFSDSVDPSIYFQVHHYTYDWSPQYSYVAANGHNQQPAGIHQSQGQHTNNGYGLWSYISFTSQYLENDTGSKVIVTAPDYQQFFVSMDYETKQVYAPGFPKVTNAYADLDDKTMFQNVWTGFPSGKAQLSVSAYGYYGASANICITGVYGIDDLSNNVYVDKQAPVVTVDEEYASGMPDGLVGSDYAIPSATAFDDYARACDVKVSVKYNYGTDNATDVPVVDGKFKPERVGTYAIVYGATDVVGNYGEAVKWITVRAEIPDSQFDIPADKATTAEIGSLVAVPSIDPATITGGSGKKTVKTFVEIDGEREEIDGSFRALKLGTYKVVYAVTDYVGQTTEKSYDVVISDGTSPILERAFDLYPTYISGNSYTLPEYYAYDYVNGTLERNLCDVVINGTTYKAGETVKIEVAENEADILFEIKSKGVTLATHTAKGVLAWTVVDESNRLAMENYFVGEGFTKERTSDGIQFTSTGDSYSLVYANAFSNKYFTATVGSVLGTTASTKLTFKLVDVLDNAKSLAFTLGSTGSDLYLEAGAVRQVMAGKTFGGTQEYTVLYQNGTVSVGDASIDVSALENFESDKVYLEISVENVEVGASLLFVEFANARFSTAKTDRIQPVLLSEVETGGTWKPGQLYNIYAPIAYDALAPNLDFTLTVTNSKKEAIKDVNGVLLENVDPTKDYVISLDEIGYYLVSYSAKESSEFIKRGNEATLVYTINVCDEVAPEIKWNGEFVTEAKVGDTIVVPTYTVTDNFTASENIVVCVFVENPMSELILLPGNAIKVNHEGVYEFRVLVADEAGNLVHQTFTVNVTK